MFFALFILSAEFWNEPHMSIVRIAEKSITSRQRQWLNILFNTWPSEPATMISAATWHDDVNGYVARLMAQWHFSDTPIIADGFNITEYPYTYNVTTVLRDTLDGLFDPTTTNVWALHFLFRNLAHFIGDVHTPVHAAAFYSKQFPSGDRGGNSVKFDKNNCTFGEACKNLHKIWDSGVLNYQYRFIDDEDILQEFEYNISHVMKMHQKEELPEINILDPMVWNKEAYNVARDYAYGKLIDMEDDKARYKRLQGDYVEEGQQQVELLIVKAGYRLAKVIDKFFEIHNPEDPRLAAVEAMPGREIFLWVVDSLLIVVVIIYSIWLILDMNLCHRRLINPKYDDISVAQPNLLE